MKETERKKETEETRKKCRKGENIKDRESTSKKRAS